MCSIYDLWIRLYFNCVITVQPIKSNTIRRVTVVILSARELSIGITKLSGSNPFLYARIDTIKEIRAITATAIMFNVNKREVKPKNACNSNMLFKKSERAEKDVNIINEAVHAPKI